MTVFAGPAPSERNPVETCFAQETVDRAQGCLVGQIAGDALGALVEFKTKAEIAALYPARLTELAAGGPWTISAGQPTDDSELALTLARQLVQDGSYDRHRVFAAYQAWMASGPFDIGSTTSAALARPLDEVAPSESQANGSLMRISPIGVFAAGRPARAAELAATDSRLTHPHPVCVAACASYAAAISIGVATGSRPAMMQAAHDFAGSGQAGDVIRRVLFNSMTSPPFDYQHQMGWVLIALQNAFYHLMNGKTVGEAVIDTVAQGGDTDTNGAVVGALVGSADRLATIPAQWTLAILACRPDRADLTVRQPRPATYWPHQALDLAPRLLELGVLADHPPSVASKTSERHQASDVDIMRALAQHLPAVRDYRGQAGELGRPTPVDSVVEVPSMRSSASIDAFVRDAYDLGWMLPMFNWPSWAGGEEAARLRDDEAALAQATPQQLRRLLTLCIRQDRFCDGALIDAFGSGLILRIVQRAAVIASSA